MNFDIQLIWRLEFITINKLLSPELNLQRVKFMFKVELFIVIILKHVLREKYSDNIPQFQR